MALSEEGRGPETAEGVGRGPARPRKAAQRQQLSALTLSLAVLVSAVVGVVVRGTPVQALVLRYAFSPGETRNYDYTANGKVKLDFPGEPLQNFDTSMSGTTTMRVVDRRPDGSTTFDVTKSLTVREGSQSPETVSGTLRMRIARDGRLLSIEGTGGELGDECVSGVLNGLLGTSGDASGGQDLFPRFPDDPVAPGDHWSKEGDMPFLGGLVHVVSKGSHEGFEDTAFGRAVRLQQEVSITDFKVEIPLGQVVWCEAKKHGQSELTDAELKSLGSAKMTVSGSMQMRGLSLVLPTDGETVKADMDMDMMMSMRFEGLPAEVHMPTVTGGTDGTMHMTMTRTS